MKRQLCLLLAIAMMCGICAMLGGCNTPVGPADDTTTATPDDTTTAMPDDTTTATPDDTTTATPDEPVKPKTETYMLNDEIKSKIKILGRNVPLTVPGVVMDWSASGIEFNANFGGTLVANIHASSNSHINVYIDGTLWLERYELTAGTKNYTLTRNLSDGDHTVRIIKCDPVSELVTLYSLTFAGTFNERPADKDLFIEFIGDSITCGNGAAGSSGKEYIANAHLSYAYLTAQNLNADYSLVSQGGVALYKNGASHIPSAYNLYTRASYFRDTNLLYTHERKADIVVIALNTNERSDYADVFTYKEKLVELVETIRSIHGEDVQIIWVSTLMYSAGMPDAWVDEVFMDELGGEKNGVWHLYAEPDSSGGATHPSKAGHARNAEILTQFINDNILG